MLFGGPWVPMMGKQIPVLGHKFEIYDIHMHVKFFCDPKLALNQTRWAPT